MLGQRSVYSYLMTLGEAKLIPILLHPGNTDTPEARIVDPVENLRAILQGAGINPDQFADEVLVFLRGRSLRQTERMLCSLQHVPCRVSLTCTILNFSRICEPRQRR
jgi:hypothetical protein